MERKRRFYFVFAYVYACVSAPGGERKSYGNVSSSCWGRTQVARCGRGRLNLLSQLTRTGINFIFEALRIELLCEGRRLSPELYSNANVWLFKTLM